MIGDERYFQAYKSYFTTKQETEAPIYDQILQIEAIELHKLTLIIESKGGLVLDLNTDCVSCCFKDDKLPFDLYDTDSNDVINLKHYYFDKDCKVPMYKLEDKDRLKIPKLSNFFRTEFFDFNISKWNITDDVSDNDFNPLVNLIIDSNKGINIDGCAGSGKSTLINMLKNKLDNKEIEYITLAPTNKAAGIVGGQTIHKYVSSQSRKSLTASKISYIFIDEISMIPEYFYKFFIIVKRLRPDIKFIMSGDFRQLAPVKDRIDPDYDYKESPALFELSDSNRLQLKKCRRSDNELFNMCTIENIPLVKRSDFTNIFTDKHLCFTNKKRIEINKIMMDKVVKSSNDKPYNISKLRNAKGEIYDENSQDVQLLIGMPIISRVNNKKLNIVNNDMFDIMDIDIENDLLKISSDGKNQEVPLKDFQKLFYVAYCITNHKSQGATITGPYTIHEFSKYDDKMKYVALTRATHKRNINIM
jgi:energy-coupling factor transporter ATP-binding protein EcfA2